MKERELKCLYINYEHVEEYDQVPAAGTAPPFCDQSCRALALERCCLAASMLQDANRWRRSAPVCPLLTSASPPVHACRAQSLAANVVEAYYRLEPFLRAAVASFVRQHLDTFAENEDGSDKQFWLSFYGLPQTDRLRALRSAKIGKLSQFVGTVTRTTDVRPELFSGTFRCMECMSGERLAGCRPSRRSRQRVACSASAPLTSLRAGSALHSPLGPCTACAVANSAAAAAPPLLTVPLPACAVQWCATWSSSSSTPSPSSAPTPPAATRQSASGLRCTMPWKRQLCICSRHV